MLWDGGVIVAFGTDNPPALGRSALLEEARLLNQVLSNEEVLQALTLNAARFLDMGDELGSLEQGKHADIVVLDGDPLADIGVLDKVKLVIKAGEIVVDNRPD